MSRVPAFSRSSLPGQSPDQDGSELTHSIQTPAFATPCTRHQLSGLIPHDMWIIASPAGSRVPVSRQSATSSSATVHWAVSCRERRTPSPAYQPVKVAALPACERNRSRSASVASVARRSNRLRRWCSAGLHFVGRRHPAPGRRARSAKALSARSWSTPGITSVSVRLPLRQREAPSLLRSAYLCRRLAVQ